MYRRALEAFNKAWLPVLLNAAQRGDKVAVVILRQCETTSVLDRSQIESTCDENFTRRTFAISLLQKTGFEPAFLHEMETPNWRDPKQTNALQKHIIELFKQGIFGVNSIGAMSSGNTRQIWTSWNFIGGHS